MGNNYKQTTSEYNRLMEIINYRFPHSFKKIGLLTALALFVFIFFYKFYGANSIIVKEVIRTLILVFLLLASLSRDKVEDEYVNHVRHQSYVIAFVCATVYAVALPLIAFALDILIHQVANYGELNYHEVSAFEVIFTLLCFQLLFFETLKRFGCA